MKPEKAECDPAYDTTTAMPTTEQPVTSEHSVETTTNTDAASSQSDVQSSTTTSDAQTNAPTSAPSEAPVTENSGSSTSK